MSIFGTDPLVVEWDYLPFDFSELGAAFCSFMVFERIRSELIIQSSRRVALSGKPRFRFGRRYCV